MPRFPNTPEQRRGDFFMLGITPHPSNGKYQVGPWSLYGPAMEDVRQNYILRQALLLVNPKVPKSIKKMVLGSMMIERGEESA